MELALQLLSRMTEANWEDLWPAFQNVLTGLGSAAILLLKRKALSNGLVSLANRLDADIDVSGVVQDESHTLNDMSLPEPYVSAPTFNDADVLFTYANEPDWVGAFTKPDDGRFPPIDLGKRSLKVPDYFPPFKPVPPYLADWAIKALGTIRAMQRVKDLLPDNMRAVAGQALGKLDYMFSLLMAGGDSPEGFKDVYHSAYFAVEDLRELWAQASAEAIRITEGGKSYSVSTRHFVEVAGKMINQLKSALRGMAPYTELRLWPEIVDKR